MVASGSRRSGVLVSSRDRRDHVEAADRQYPEHRRDNDTVGAAGGRGRVKRRRGEGAAHALGHDDDHRQGGHEGRLDDHGHADHPRRDLHLPVGRGGHQGHHGQPAGNRGGEGGREPHGGQQGVSEQPEHDRLQRAGEGVLGGLNPADPRATRRPHRLPQPGEGAASRRAAVVHDREAHRRGDRRDHDQPKDHGHDGAGGPFNEPDIEIDRQSQTLPSQPDPQDMPHPKGTRTQARSRPGGGAARTNSRHDGPGRLPAPPHTQARAQTPVLQSNVPGAGGGPALLPIGPSAEDAANLRPFSPIVHTKRRRDKAPARERGDSGHVGAPHSAAVPGPARPGHQVIAVISGPVRKPRAQARNSAASW